MALELYLIACCLFAPADRESFEIELREGQRTDGGVMYVQRTDAGFSIYGDKERRGGVISVKKTGDRYAVVRDRGGKRTEFVIDNSKAGIRPLEKDGKYIKEVEGLKLTFEIKEGTRKVYQERKDKLFILK